MEFIAYAALILLSAAGYAAGAALRAGKKRAEPGLPDLGGQALVWAGAVVSRTVWGWNRWLAIPVWLAASMACGIAFSRPRGAERKISGQDVRIETRSKYPLGRAWAGWKRFSRKMGDFQGRMLLSWVYFLLVSPFALAVRFFSDPLNIKKKKEASHWVPRKRISSNLGEAGRQF